MDRSRLASHQKKCRRLGATLVFFDETGFLTQPYGKRTWAPVGQTPTIKHRLRGRERITVIGSLTVSPARHHCGLYAEFLPGRGVNQDDLIAHFQCLRRRLRTSLVILLDNLNLHKGKQLRSWCEKVGDVHLEFLPPYAPELNPIESVWGHGKCVTAAGRLAEDAQQLEQLAREAVSAADEQRLLHGFIRSTKLPIRFCIKSRKPQSDAQ